MTTKNEIWVLAKVEGDGSVQLSIPTNPKAPDAVTPVSGKAVLSITSRASCLSVSIRLRVRSSCGCVPAWTAISPARRVSLGDALSAPLIVPKTGSAKLEVALQVDGVSAGVELQLGRAAGGIDIILRPPPVEPPVSACGGTTLAVVPRTTQSPEGAPAARPWHERATG